MAYMFEPRVARCRSRPTDNGRGPSPSSTESENEDSYIVTVITVVGLRL